jgi:hypothetical protein
VTKVRAVTAGAVWLAVVLGCSWLVWLAIDQAGRGALGSAASASAAVGSPGVEPGFDVTGSATATRPPGSLSPTAAGVVSSLTVVGGSVSVSCSGETITLRSATPAQGWSFTVERESRTLTVEFGRVGGDERSEIEGRCVRGRPQLTAD